MKNKDDGKKLTEQLVLTKTKSPNLQMIKHLNLWGNDLQDLSIIQGMPNLEVISLSVNRIRSLKYFIGNEKLQELYLRKNNIADIHQIMYLAPLPLLKTLWLHDNPCSEIPNYRSIVIKYLIHLLKLDNNPIMPEERVQSEKLIYYLKPIQQPDSKSIQQQQDLKEDRQDYENELTPQIQQVKENKRASLVSFQSLDHFQDKKIKLNQKKRNSQIENQQQNKSQEQENQKEVVQRFGMHRDVSRNQNVLIAVLSLIKQLDPVSLEIVRTQTQKLVRPK